MRILDVEKALKHYGNISLGELLEQTQGPNKYKCPKCHGEGTVSKCVVRGVYGYTDDVYSDVKCEVCDGIGYTRTEMKPKYKTELIGYE